MLPSFTTSSRRRGLRGASRKASREQVAAGPSSGSALYSLSSRASSSASLGSDSTISKMSFATSQTSISLASSSHLKEDRPTFVSRPVNTDRPVPDSPAYPAPDQPHLSPIEVFKLRLAGGKHSRKESSTSVSGSTTGVRVVGRGGQGSRPRAVPADSSLPSALPAPLPARNVRMTSTLTGGNGDQPSATRIVGRGGVGSRPRGLSAVDSMEPAPRMVEAPPPPVPKRPAALIQETPPPPVVYRPGGRGGAGSRPRKVKPKAETGSAGNSKDFKFPWKGKGRAEPFANALTRTDTRDSTASSINFASPAARQHQKPINPDPFDFSGASGAPSVPSRASPNGSTSSFQTTSSDGRHARQQSKLGRTLGADFGSAGMNWSQRQKDIQVAKLARRSSISVPSPRATESPRSDHFARRQSSYGQLSGFLPPDDSDEPLVHHEVWDSNNYRPAVYLADPKTSQPQYPTPPPAQALPDDPYYTEDDISEVLTFDASDESAGPRFSSYSQSSGEIHVQPRFVLEDTDDDESQYEPGQMQTPTPFAAHDSRPETPTADEKRFDSPYQVMPLFVVPPWEPKARPAGAAAEELSQEWVGEWNRTDMQSVIHSLRQLRM
ncbi:hypothetical protein B0H17DRAFT_1073097 [Mycena rosella]|uniref:Uncharacterized protein n=1 Tax=Mycena rosella TaxID=1033263 RepID=A0AAD7GAW3_MYCRO|nr:hypothetical protein B0H17DRAFT_1073097 [Mycena rosella]